MINITLCGLCRRVLHDWKIEDIEDVKISMVDKQQGDSIKIKILRKRFLLGDKVLEFTVAL